MDTDWPALLVWSPSSVMVIGLLMVQLNVVSAVQVPSPAPMVTV